MYGTFHTFFGLSENPFNATSDPRFLVLTDNMRRGLAELTHAVHARRGLILLTGEPGTGKTVLVYHLLCHLRAEDIPRAFIFNPHLNVNELFELTLADFGATSPPNMNATPVARLQHWLSEPHRVSDNAVLIIDEAQDLPRQVLEEIRLLLNSGGVRGKRLQVILAGQPELDEKLKRPEFRALRQQISLRCTTAPLSRTEVDEYIAGRLRVAGAGSAVVFPNETTDLLYFYSCGIPRVLNLLCEHSLMRACEARSQSVSSLVVEAVARHLQFDDPKGVAPSARITRAAAAGAVYQNSDTSRDPIEVPSTEPQASNLRGLEKKYPVIEFLESFVSPPAPTSNAAAAETQERGEELRPTVTPRSSAAPEAMSVVFWSEPAPVSLEGKRLPETRDVIETFHAFSAPEEASATPMVSWKSVQLIVDRIKHTVGIFCRSALMFATSSTRRVRLAKFSDTKRRSQSWRNILHWLQEPMRSGKTRRGVSHKAFFTRLAGH